MHADHRTPASASTVLAGDWRALESDSWRALHPRAPQPLSFLRQQMYGNAARQHTESTEATDGGLCNPKYGIKCSSEVA